MKKKNLEVGIQRFIGQESRSCVYHGLKDFRDYSIFMKIIVKDMQLKISFSLGFHAFRLAVLLLVLREN